MKILFSAQGDSSKSMVDQRFGRAAFYVIYDDEKDTYEAIENLGKHENSGAGVKASQFVIEQGAEVVITGSLGPKAFMIIQDAGIRGFKNFNGTIEEVLAAYKNNELEELTAAGQEQKVRGRFR